VRCLRQSVVPVAEVSRHVVSGRCRFQIYENVRLDPELTLKSQPVSSAPYLDQTPQRYGKANPSPCCIGNGATSAEPDAPSRLGVGETY